MRTRVLYALACIGLLISAAPTYAQTGGSGSSCFFPLACPGPTPPKPEPLLGPPEDKAEAQPAEPATKTKRQAHRRAAKKAH
jgi:hypothetical protein